LFYLRTDCVPGKNPLVTWPRPRD